MHEANSSSESDDISERSTTVWKWRQKQKRRRLTPCKPIVETQVNMMTLKSRTVVFQGAVIQKSDACVGTWCRHTHPDLVSVSVAAQEMHPINGFLGFVSAIHGPHNSGPCLSSDEMDRKPCHDGLFYSDSGWAPIALHIVI